MSPATPVAVVLGLALGLGLLLVAAPLLHSAGPVRDPGRRTVALADRLAQAGIGVAPGAFVAVSVVLGVVLGGVLLGVTGLPVLALLGALVGASAPLSLVRSRGRARLRASRTLWPLVADALVASLRAGRPLPDAVAALATVGPAPFRPGFALFERRWQETGSVGQALDALKDHFADPTADRLAETLRMARQVGGTELPGVLRSLAAHLRQDVALRAEAEARQGWVVTAAKLGVAAPWAVLLLLCVRPEGAAAFATPLGTAVVVGALAVTATAYRLMLAIGRLPEEPRWFR